MTGRTRQADRQKRIGRTGQAAQDRQEGTAWTGFDSPKRTARKGQPERDGQKKAAMTGLPGHEPGQNCQDRTAITGLHG
jgi:hypothetical protein